MHTFLIILLAIAIGISVIEDIRRQKIPNVVTFLTMVLALAYHSFSGGVGGFLFSIEGLAIGIGLFIIPYLMGGMGAGDAKLMGAVGAILGPKGTCIAAIIIYLAGGLYGAILFAMHPKFAVSFLKRLWTTIKTFFLTAQFIYIPPDKNEKQPVLRYAIPIAVGALSYLIIKVSGYDLVPKFL